jgi:hypothetical protein
MADIVVTAGSVIPTSPSTVVASGIAGAAITAGQVVYADPSDSYKIKPAKADSASTTHAPNVVGIALNGASAGQPVDYAKSGDVTFNAVLTKGQVYVDSAANAGGIAPYSDLASTNFVTLLGVALSTTVLRLNLLLSNIQK